MSLTKRIVFTLAFFVFCYLFSLAGALYFAVSPSLVGIGLWDFAMVV
ncbi:hypothetical protein [Enterococcus cecorum]